MDVRLQVLMVASMKMINILLGYDAMQSCRSTPFHPVFINPANGGSTHL
jgi:hypothetical protein